MGQAVSQVLGISNEQADTNSSGISPFYFPDMCGQVLPTNIHFLLCCASAFNIRGTSTESYFFWRLGYIQFWNRWSNHEAACEPVSMGGISLYLFCLILFSLSLILPVQNETKIWNLRKALDVSLPWSKAGKSCCFPEPCSKKKQWPKLDWNHKSLNLF